MEGLCIHCKTKPEEEESVDCVLCNATWHDTCLFNLREMYEFTESDWGCPDCNDKNNPNQQGAVAAATATAEGINMLGTAPPNNSSTSSSSGDTMVAKILAIQADPSLTEEEKARKRQELLGGNEKGKGKEETVALTAASGDENFNCCICFNVLDRPVSTPCGHNLCLNCFVQSLKKSGKRNCPVCRNLIPTEMAKQPRINVTLVIAIRSAKMSWNRRHLNQGPSTDYVRNEDKPDEAYTTERAKKGGMANAKSGKIFVNVKNDHFGPILAEHDLKRNLGVEVGETWGNRLECRQWGVHFPQIKGIAGQKDQGAQSVILSGGYEDDEDHGEWFLYTGSGGRDLSGNKRTNKNQSFDQDFKKANQALLLSCTKGYPVRVVRSSKDKHSSYAPENGKLRYDGIYRVEKCWQHVGLQGFKVCRYLFVRCDNAPAPWTSDEHGDRPRPLPVIEELEKSTDIVERTESPSWDFDEVDGCWKWMKPPPISKYKEYTGNSSGRKRSSSIDKPVLSEAAKKRLRKQYGCPICQQVLDMPVTTPCGHNFCKGCLERKFSGQSLVRERKAGERALRSQRNVMKCPSCPADLSEYLNNLQVNIELKNLILQQVGEIQEDSDDVKS